MIYFKKHNTFFLNLIIIFLLSLLFIVCSAPKYDEDFLKEEEDNFLENIIVHHVTDSSVNLKMDSINSQVNSLEKLYSLLSDTLFVKKIDSMLKDIAEIKRNISSPLLIDKTDKRDSSIKYAKDLSKRIDNIEKKLKSYSENRSPVRKNIGEKSNQNPEKKDINTFDDYNTNYDYGVSLFKARKYDEAIQVFEKLLSSKLQKPELIDNIYYWIGECFYGKGQFETAIERFNKVLTVPKANKAEDALMMMGHTYEKLNKVEEAREAYQRLIDTQPKSRYRLKAKEKLKSLI